MAKEYTPEELGLPSAQKEYTPEELGLTAQSAQKEYTPEELGLAPMPQGQVTVQGAPKQEKPMGVIGAIGDVLTPSQATLGAGEIGIVNAKLAATQAQIAQLANIQAADKKNYGENYEHAPAKELPGIIARDQALEKHIAELAQYGVERKDIEAKRGVNPLVKEISTIRNSDEYKDADNFDQLKMYGKAIWDKKADLPGYIASIGLESLPSTVPTIAAAMAARFGGLGPTGAAIMGGGGSALTEFGNQYAELRSAGMSHEEAWEKAGVKSAVIGLFDAASFKSAGHSAGMLLKDIEKGYIKEAAKETGKEVSKQALYGMAGEGLGSVAINQKVDPISVIEEGLGEVVGAPFEAVSTFKTKQQEGVNTQKELARYEELKNFDQFFTPEQKQEFDALRQKYEPQNAPPITTATPEQIAAANQPKIVSSEGAPIPTVPLNTAEQQATAKAAAPITPVAAPQPEEEKINRRAEQLKAEYNIPTDDAFRMARQEHLEEQAYGGETPTTRAIPGTAQPSVPVSGAGTAPTGGVTTPNLGGLASPVSGIGRPVTGEEVQPSALTPAPEAVAPQQTLQVVAPEAGVVAPEKPRGKQRGRPAVQLTPEEQTAKKQAKAAQTKDWKATDKTLDAARAVLEETEPTRDNFATQDAYLDAGVQFRARRNQALDTLHGVATGPQRGGKLGTKAKVGLDHPSITAQERTAIQGRANFKKQMAAKSVSKGTAAISEVANPAYSRFDSATSAINYIIKTGNRFEKAMARALKPFVKNTIFIVANSERDLPDIKLPEGNLKQEFKNARGLFTTATLPDGTKRDFIILRGEGFGDPSLQGVNNEVFLHEVLHNGTVAKVDEYYGYIERGETPPADLQELMDNLHNIMSNAKIAVAQMLARGERLSPELLRLFAPQSAGGLDVLNDPREFIAYGLSNEAMQEFLLSAKGEAQKGKEGFFKNLFSRFVNTLRSAFNMGDEHMSALQDLMLVTQGLLSAQQAQPAEVAGTSAAKKVKEKVDKNLEKIRLSNSAHDITKSVGRLILDRDFEGFKDLLDARFSAMGNGFISKLLYAMQSADIIRWKGDEIPALQALDEITQKMSSMKLRLQHAFATKADQLGNYIRKNGMQTLGDAMHLARLESVSPTQYTDVNDALASDKLINQLKAIIANPNTPQEKVPAYKGQLTIREKGIKKVFEAWEKLNPEGKKMYEMVRQFYKDNYTLTRTLLDDKIAKLDIEGDINDASTPKGKLMTAVRRMQEATETKFDENGKKIKSLPEEYFPFMREGQYWLRVNGPAGREFYLFENGTDRNLFQIKRARELKVDRNDTAMFSAGDDISALRKTMATDSAMLKEMFAAIDETKATDKRFSPSNYPNAADPDAAARQALDTYKEELKDQLYQVYLMSLPEKSFRKQFLHADNVTGFSADIFRNFKISGMRLSTQAARLKYADDLEAAIQRGRDTLSGNPDKSKLELFVNELGSRAREEINPPSPNGAATFLNQLAYYWLLTAPASAATQMASIPIMVMPSLNQEYGYGKASVKLAKYMNIWKSMGVTKLDPNGDVVYTAPSIGNSKLVKGNPILEKAFDEFVNRGVTTLTNTSVLTNRNRTPDNSYDNIPGVAFRTLTTTMSALFNGAERISREMSAMMTFELEYAKTKDFEKSVDKAVETTQELLGRYDNFNRPRILRNFAGKTIGQFKMYAVNVTSFFVRNAYNAFNVTNPKDMLPAMERLAGTLVMGGLFHGLVGMPLYSVICSTIDAVMNNLGDEEERRKRRAKNPLTSDNSNLRFRYEYLPQHFGNIQITGIDGMKHGLNELLEKGPISALTDMNVGSRTSFDGLWFRDAKQGKTNLETFQNIVLANLGPGASVGFNAVGAMDDFNRGEIERGLEKLVPAFFKGPLVAERMGTEGAETKKGDQILKPEEIKTSTLIGQTLGFQSTKLSRLQEEGFAIQKELAEARNTRTELLQKLDRTLLDKDSSKEDMKKVFNQISQYNKRYPMEEFIIDGDVIESSINTAIENKGIAFRGQQIKEKLLPYLVPLRKAAAPAPQ